MATNSDTKHDHSANRDPQKDEGLLDRLAKTIDPPGREVSNDDLSDPGRMTPDAPPVDDRS